MSSISNVDIEALLQIAATGLAGIFAGSATYISAVQHPALLKTDASTEFQSTFFRNMYFDAARMQAPLAVGSGISALVTYYLQRDRASADEVAPLLWLSSGCAMIAIVPYTKVNMLGVNYQLIDTKLCVAQGPKWMQQMLVRWGRLHSVRTGLSLLAFTGMVVTMTYAKK
uniref:Uncharacterized protein n=1 Tax=Globisporangium ultimum (strain ATCC 200006 / CBS 805.95 / DAOM BR144) TaxID=431595 RepID=K3X528_GLOUD